MTSNIIVAYSFLVFVYEGNRNNFKDLSDVFIPLVKRTLSKMYSNNHRKGKSIEEIKIQFDEMYGLNIPFSILRKILKKVEDEERKIGNTKFTVFDSDGFIIEDYTYLDYEDDIEKQKTEIDDLNQAYHEFVKVEGKQIENEPSIFEFIDQNRITLCSFFSKNEKFEVDGKYFLQAKFIELVKETLYFETLKKIYLGSIISSYLEINIAGLNEKLELLVDTNFIIGAINLSSAESYHTCKTIIEIAGRQEYLLSVLPETINEAKNLLNNHANNFDRAVLLSLVDEQNIYFNCHRQGLKGHDLSRKAFNLEADLKDMGIEVVSHQLEKSAKFDPAYEFFKAIRNDEAAAIHDTIAVLYVRKKREKLQKKVQDFSDINSWFVSNTKSKIFYKFSYPEVIRAEDLLNLLWLSNPLISNTDAILESGLTRLVATTISKSLPKQSTLRQLNDNIFKYLKREKIRIKDVSRLAKQVANRTLTNLDELNQLSTKGNGELIEEIKKISTNQEKIDARKAQKFNTFFRELESKKEASLLSLEAKLEANRQKNDDSLREEQVNNARKIHEAKIEALKDKEVSFSKLEKICQKSAKRMANRYYFFSVLICFLCTIVVLYIKPNILEAYKHIAAAIFFIYTLIILPFWAFKFQDELKWHKYYDWLYKYSLNSHQVQFDYIQKEHLEVKQKIENMEKQVQSKNKIH